jgi:hypothetical protein
MKKNTLTFILLLTVVLATAQTKTKSYPSNTVQKPATLQPVDKNIPVPKLPDLKITAFNVTATPSHFDSIQKYNLNVSFTVKNEGYASVLTDDVILEAFLSDETWVTRANKNLAMTGFYVAAGGRILSSIHGRGETLEPGASKQISLNSTNQILKRNPKSIFIVNIRTGGNIVEINSGNNLEYVTIIF